MGNLPVDLLTSLSTDLQDSCGYTRDELLRMPAIPPDADHVLAASWLMANSFSKKFLPSNTDSQDQAALAKFLSFNVKAGQWQLELNTSADEELYSLVRGTIESFLMPRSVVELEGRKLVVEDRLFWTLSDLLRHGRCGPGASRLSANGDWYTKLFSSALSATSRNLISTYKAYVNQYPVWLSAELHRSAAYGPGRIVEGSALCFVPKNDTISRSICTEPTLNMFYQLGLASMLEGRLRSYFGISMAHQPDLNRDLARLGSVDGSWSTIDLESASDSVSCELVRKIFPDWFAKVLFDIRSPKTVYQGREIDLNILSSMGNGFTFPLQTLIFASIVRAVAIQSSRDFSVHVFGDDIVVPGDMYLRVLHALKLFGFVVNSKKSFNEGPFRESCGKDYFSGRNVRGVYLTRLASEQDSYAAINACVEWTARTGLSSRRVVQWLLRTCKRILLVPPHADPSGGVRVPERCVWHHRKGFESGRSSNPKVPLYQSLVYVLWEFEPRKLAIKERRQPFKLIYNPDGYLLCAVAGVVNSSGLPLRKSGHWKRKQRSSSFWDSFAGEVHPERDGFTWQQWNTAVYETLE